jgi:phage FluMu protein Com
MIQIVERTDIQPKCPHCKTELPNIYIQELSGYLGKRYVYFCPRCHSVLGISHRKGFWMG